HSTGPIHETEPCLRTARASPRRPRGRRLAAAASRRQGSVSWMGPVEWQLHRFARSRGVLDGERDLERQTAFARGRAGTQPPGQEVIEPGDRKSVGEGKG